MGLMVSSKFVEKLQILKVSVIPKVTRCGLKLWGGPLCLCRDTTAILAQFRVPEGDSTLGLTSSFFMKTGKTQGERP